MDKQSCPNCKRNIRWRDAFKTFICDKCKNEYDKNLNLIGKSTDNFRLDDYGNKYQIEIKKQDNKIIETKTYFLEAGKTTLKTEHSKLKEIGCKFLNRLSCNYGIGFERCEFMNYNQDINSWECKCP